MVTNIYVVTADQSRFDALKAGDRPGDLAREQWASASRSPSPRWPAGIAAAGLRRITGATTCTRIQIALKGEYNDESCTLTFAEPRGARTTTWPVRGRISPLPALLAPPGRACASVPCSMRALRWRTPMRCWPRSGGARRPALPVPGHRRGRGVRVAELVPMPGAVRDGRAPPMPAGWCIVQLYRDYLDNFRLNALASGDGGGMKIEAVGLSGTRGGAACWI